MIAELFFFVSDRSDHSDRSNHMEARLQVERVALGNKIGKAS